MHTYQFQIETYDWRTDTYDRNTEWDAPIECDSDQSAETAARDLAVGIDDATRVYIRRDDGAAWHIG